MHRAAVGVFLAGVFVVGLAPLLFLPILALRRPSSGQERKGGRHQSILILAAGVLGLALLAGLGWAALRSRPPATGHSGKASPDTSTAEGSIPGQVNRPPLDPASLLPPSLAGLPITSSKTGAEGLAAVEALHGKEIPLLAASLATYSTPQARAELWVALVASEKEAERMVRTMAEKISRGATPFSPPSPSSRGGLEVWQTRGLGQDHFFFARASTVWWLAADTGVSSRALEDLLTAVGRLG